MTPQVLVVEDEADLVELLRYNLEAENFTVATAEDAEEAMLRIAENTPDIILLDWMLPGTSGIEICRRIRARTDTARIPIIMLTARGEEEERVRGLATGADDYVVKPFSLPELMARINALLRRSNPQLIAAILKAGDIELDRTTHRVRRSGKEVHLGPTEYRLLEYLMGNPGRVYSREQLLDGVWGTDVYVDERTVDVHVGRLRKAINRGRVKDPIRTVRGAGYAFDEKFVAN
ncbi:phosphate regulon transcriptional regulator PhoB [Pelagibacterium halotolerans]|uniref:Phosphate regulon transcriptional regulatory protein PhoB n=1 Tax=Pelagibacterium halotolerans (strain DSM 22347 / JCM 15775 / CGMCC 1.7692 / B2) TaxID=1082931 RepID=G4R8R7_PELHB|nr:phosphate regulon transcriptional regulator PhoB [Pelagibacterium halotolerans]AEQ50353.1 phosphate regulon transcriptional regulatory protein PhoB (SphR) [Pelagibacterium halotolerans B2]QJR19668.1 phosphate regulon transcriptional regulator PhoB [Pelagibacterium halotolerans]SEA98474.1 two-component system, OmpR family, phosphate regulon response regulator PhoB [Pelagibacterium halotolerans]